MEEELVALAWSSSECTALHCYDNDLLQSTMTVCGGLSASYFGDVVARAFFGISGTLSRSPQDAWILMEEILDRGLDGHDRGLDGWQDKCELDPDIEFREAMLR